MTLTVAVSHGLRRLLLESNIYRMKLVRRGHYMPQVLQANAHLVHHVGDMAMASARTIDPGFGALALALALAQTPDATAYVVLAERGNIMGVLSSRWAAEHPEALVPGSSATSLGQTGFAVVSSETTLFELIAMMQRTRADLAVVLSTTAEQEAGSPWVRGVVSKAHLAEAMAEGMEIFED